jgi:hypothetical protein
MKQVKCTFVTVCVYALVAMFIGSGFMSLNAAEVKAMTQSGYQKISLFSSRGKVTLCVPDTYSAGDRVSGKMTAEPSGKTAKKTSKNAKLLERYSIEIAGVKTRVRNGWITWKVPDAKEFTVTLLTGKGKPVDSTRMPAHHGSGKMKPQDFRCPEIVQVGHAFPIPGKYNGTAGDTHVTAGDRELQLLTESPYAVIVEPPHRETGVMEISVTEGKDVNRFKTRNISVRLSADDLHLKRGQNTNLRITVEGLEGLDKSLPLYVTNHSPETISIKGEGTIRIEPSEVNPEDGSFVFKSSIFALNSGSFMITARVFDEFVFAPPIQPPLPKVDDNRKKPKKTLEELEKELDEELEKAKEALKAKVKEVNEKAKKLEKRALEMTKEMKEVNKLNDEIDKLKEKVEKLSWEKAALQVWKIVRNWW